MVTQADKAQTFRALHEREGAFVIPNPWDIGSARVLAGLGYEALATTSAGFAFIIGQRDNTVGRDDLIAHVRTIVDATDLPVNADLGNGQGETLDDVAETYRLATAAGLAGASIEDMADDGSYAIFELEKAVDRVRAAVDVVRGLPFPFMLTARAENYLVGRRDLGDTIKRLQAYREAGADVLYAPGITSKEEIAAVVSSVDRPVNVIVGIAGMALTLEDLSGLGVKRISVGSALARVAISAFVRAAREMRETGAFTFAEGSLPFRRINELFPE